jgi:hypothetical protein
MLQATCASVHFILLRVGPGGVPGSRTRLQKQPPQVAHPGDASNFKPHVDDGAAGGAYRDQPYKTTGDFANF